MFINFWYVADESRKVAEQPVHVRMLGQDFVLFRDSSGAAHCLSNVCVHRGGSLALGKLKGDFIECPYHGWQFSGDGLCRRVPSMGPDAKIPGRAKVDSYPVQEKYGYIFVFLGDLPEDQRPPIMDVQGLDDDAWATTYQSLEADIYYQRSIENSLDCTHNDYVHEDQHVDATARGARDIIIYDEENTDWVTFFRTKIPVKGRSSGSFQQEAQDNIFHGVVDMGQHCISNFWTYIELGPDMKLLQHFFETPIDETRTRLFVVMMRNFMRNSEGDEMAITLNNYVLKQDIDTLLGVRPIVSPKTNIHETLVPGDRPISNYRKKVKQYEARGWRIDTDEVNKTGDNVAYAIPSPARRQSKGWALDPIPLIPGHDIDLSSAAFYERQRLELSRQVLAWLRQTYQVRGGGFHIVAPAQIPACAANALGSCRSRPATQLSQVPHLL